MYNGNGSEGDGHQAADSNRNRANVGGVFSFDPTDIQAESNTIVDSSSTDVGGAAAAGAAADVGAGLYPPSTPRLLCQPEDPPDTVENVSSQADAIFRSFVFERFARDKETGRLAPGTPDSPELARERPPPLSQEARIGRQLAEIGDDIQRRYKNQFNEMIKSLEHQLTDSETSFEVFSRVALRLFRDQVINWGRVVALFFFGYRIAVEKIRSGVSGFLRQIVAWICQFLVRQRIASWIAEHGGWRSLRHITSIGEDRLSSVNITWRHLTGLSALVVLCVVVFRYHRQQ